MQPKTRDHVPREVVKGRGFSRALSRFLFNPALEAARTLTNACSNVEERRFQRRVNLLVSCRASSPRGRSSCQPTHFFPQPLYQPSSLPFPRNRLGRFQTIGGSEWGSNPPATD